MIKSFERINTFENKGSVLEYEYLNEINKNAYSQAVDEYQHPELYKIENEADVERVFLRKNAEKKDYADSFKDNSYINFKDAMQIVEKCQPGNPEAPSAIFAGALRKEIATVLGDGYKVKFFTAVGSHLDTKHGVDAFIKIYDQENKELQRVTLDISASDKGFTKADLLITISQNERDLYDFNSNNFNKDEFINRIKKEALNIVQILKNQEKNGQSVRAHSEDEAPRKKRPRISRPWAFN